MSREVSSLWIPKHLQRIGLALPHSQLSQAAPISPALSTMAPLTSTRGRAAVPQTSADGRRSLEIAAKSRAMPSPTSLAAGVVDGISQSLSQSSHIEALAFPRTSILETHDVAFQTDGTSSLEHDGHRLLGNILEERDRTMLESEETRKPFAAHEMRIEFSRESLASRLPPVVDDYASDSSEDNLPLAIRLHQRHNGVIDTEDSTSSMRRDVMDTGAASNTQDCADAIPASDSLDVSADPVPVEAGHAIVSSLVPIRRPRSESDASEDDPPRLFKRLRLSDERRQAVELQSRRGWKGWISVDEVVAEFEINSDTPFVFPTRRTRSGRLFAV
ncbi:hypothetical protein EXIGLDRAFT_779175 [Exidia glandulosa HHB12029]|uniref:Uncharacterized protein n=1 Tax=Exidia glandulosa HHB12029 TaxID=1314781 RepID=A0A165C6H2_EXIGL|nr:hypothetical protein EXIGLDRAFT_779175 [Exidia glandulosa HHB12029]